MKIVKKRPYVKGNVRRKIKSNPSGHTIGALDVLARLSPGVYKVHCRTCDLESVIGRPYLSSDRAIQGCRECSRKKNHRKQSAKSKDPAYRRWYYLVRKWTDGKIDIPTEWVKTGTGFQAYLRDMEKETKADDAS